MSKEKPTDDPRHTIQPGGLVMKSTIVIMEVKERGLRPASLRCHTAGANGGTFLALIQNARPNWLRVSSSPQATTPQLMCWATMEQR